MDNPFIEAPAPPQASIRRREAIGRPATSGNYEGPFRTSTTTLPDGRLRERRFRLDGTLASERVYGGPGEDGSWSALRSPIEEPVTLPRYQDLPLSAIQTSLVPIRQADLPGWLQSGEIIADGAGAARKLTSEELEDREAGFDVFDTIDDIGLGVPRKLDVAVNEAFGGQPGQTISARVGRREGPLQSMIADGLDFVAPGHTARALDAEYATRGINPCAPKLSAREVSKLARELCLGR